MTPDISPLPTPDPLETAQREILELKNSLRSAEHRIVQLDADNAKLGATVQKLDGNSFILLLRHLDAGAVLEEVSAKADALLQACREVGGAGKLVLTLAAKPAEGQNRALVYAAEIKVTEPKDEPPTAWIFLNKDGKPTRENWGEPRLALQDADERHN